MTEFREKYFWFDQTAVLPDDREIIVDCFAGGGGASIGIEWGCGHAPDLAINHDKSSIAMHVTNHPETVHRCENLWDEDPEEVTEGKPVGLAWFSPDCRHFSKAKGSAPVENRIRGLAWIVLKWAGTVKPRVIFVENVEEFIDWGPIRNGRPVKSKKGVTFQQWRLQLRELGYHVEWRELVASDYGAPTTRKRLFIVARCDEEPIVWPEPTHGSPKVIRRQIRRTGVCNLQTWRTAADIIDWSLPCPSIFDTAEEIKQKYGLRAQRPLAEKTMKRIAEGIRRFVIETNEPFIVQVNHGGNDFRGQSMQEPLPAVTRKHGYGLVTPFVAALQQGGMTRSIKRPLHTICASRKDCNLLVAPTLQTYYGPRNGDHHRGRTLNDPLATQTTENRHSLVTAFLAKHFGGMVGVSAANPFPTITQRGTQNQIVAAALVKYNHGQKQWFDIREPLRTIVSQGTHHAEVRAFLMKFYGSGGQWNSIGEPVPTITVKHRLALGIVMVGGEPYQIVDIGMRMLTPRELFRAQGFPDDYVIDVGLNGKPATKSEQVGRCGNSVSPYPAAAIVKANFVPHTVYHKEEIRS